MKRPTISMLLPTWRNPLLLDLTVRSAFKHSQPGVLEVLVFSQEHTEETERVVDGFRKDGLSVRIVDRSPCNEGIAIAVNACATAATGEFFLYSGDDCYFLPGWDQALLRRVKPDEWQYLTPRSIEPLGTNPCMYAPHDFGRGAEDFREADLLEFWKTLKKQDVVSRYGPVFVRRDVWEAVGGFDAGYWPGFGTDPDFAIGVARAATTAGKSVSFVAVGDCGMYHFQAVSTRRIRCCGATLAANTRFLDKWDCTTKEFGSLVGDGEPI